MIRARAWLALGANIGDPAAQLEEAIRRLAAHGQIAVTTRSSVMTSKPWGKTDQPDFRNMVIGVETSLDPEALLQAALAIETEMGRVREAVWGPRVIDIDLVAYEDRVMKTDRLILPHPYAHARDFVLDPLREIAPDIADWVVTQSAR